jgi:histidinol-phosphatase (PHP family)
MVLHNFHTHSHFSDGSDMPENYILEAIGQNFRALGFSEHSPLPFKNTFALKSESVKVYTSEIKQLREKYASQIDVFCGLEADYIPGVSESFSDLKDTNRLDYIIGSVHLVKNFSNDNDLWFIDGPKSEIYDEGVKTIFEGDIKKAVTAYWHQLNNMIEKETFDVIGHLDKVKMHNKNRWFSEADQWYQSLINETIDLIAHKNLLVEVNTRGLYKKRSESLFPGDNILKLLKDKDIGVVLSSDAHQPKELSSFFNEAEKELKEIGYSSTWVYTSSGWVDLPFNLPS